MSKKLIITLSIIVVLIIAGMSLFSQYRSVYDRNVHLWSQYTAQRKVIAGSYDDMWKIIKQKGEISDKAADKFKEIYTSIISGRYSQGDGSLMKWVTEQNPNFDQSNYKDLSQSVEILRKEFRDKEMVIVAIMQEHENLENEFWSSMFLKDKRVMEYTQLLSTKTDDVIKTGIDDDIDVFSKTK